MGLLCVAGLEGDGSADRQSYNYIVTISFLPVSLYKFPGKNSDWFCLGREPIPEPITVGRGMNHCDWPAQLHLPPLDLGNVRMSS